MHVKSMIFHHPLVNWLLDFFLPCHSSPPPNTYAYFSFLIYKLKGVSGNYISTPTCRICLSIPTIKMESHESKL